MIKSDRSRCWKLSVASYLVMGGDCLSIAVATTGRARACRQLNLECRQSNPFTAIKLNGPESQNSPPVRDV